MKPVSKYIGLMACMLLLTSYVSVAQEKKENKPPVDGELKTYLIEREIPGAAKLTAVELKNISQSSCKVIKEIGPQIQWIHSYVAGDKVYCIYKATDAELIREHAKKGGFPANRITEVASVISPATAE